MKISVIFFCCSLFMACNTPKKVQQKNNSFGTAASSDVVNETALQKTGVDFLANGNAPAQWQLQINEDDTVRFATTDGLALQIGFNQFKKTQQNEITIYDVLIKAGTVNIFISNEPCYSTSKTTVTTKKVAVTFNGNAYTGCGKYLANAALNGNWILFKVDGKILEPSEYNIIPNFNFDVDNKSLTGNDGCNTIRSSFTVKGDRILVGSFSSTKIACSKKSIQQVLVSKMENKLVSYYFKDGLLYLYLKDDSLIVFSKK